MRQRLYNPAQLSSDELKASFIARRETLEELHRIVREEKPGRPCQHFLLIGPRGMGKTTLGLRFLLSIEEDSEFTGSWQPVAFDEESYGIGDLADFWLTALDHLSRATDEPRWAEGADAIREDESDPERQAVYARAALRDFHQESGKRLILFVENLDVVFGQLGSEREVHTLRASLIERSDILLVGSANTVFDAIRGHGQPFYEFFQLFILEGLGPEDTRRMLESFADGSGTSDLPEVLRRERGRLETVRMLTGGNPRLLVLACRMLIESPLGSPLDDLERLIDEQTPYFKARIEELPVQGRRVFHCLAAGWRPMLAKEVAAAAKLSSSHASAQLRQLVEKGYARELKLPREKRVRYEVSDRFYNIYYLLRFSRTGRHRLERLVHFLHDLFGPIGMRAMYPAALDALRKQGPHSEEMSDWLGILAGYVARDDDYAGREDWRRNALDLVNDLLGANASVVGEIELAFAGQHLPEHRDLLDKHRRGAELIRGKRYADAEACYREAIQKAPANAFAWHGLGASLFLQERFEDCHDIFDQVVERVRPNAPATLRHAAATALATKSFVLARLERFESVSSVLEQISTYVNPDDNPQLREGVARLLLQTGHLLANQDSHEVALTAWEKCTDSVRFDDPVDLRRAAADALAARTRILLNLGRYEEIVVATEQATEYFHTADTAAMRLSAASALVARGAALLSLERDDDAIAAFQQAAAYVWTNDPAEARQLFAKILASVGRLLNTFGRYAESEVACRKATELEPTNASAWTVLSAAILGPDDEARLAEAEVCARRAVELEPDSAAALHVLSDLSARRGDWTKAMELLEHAVSIGDGGFQTEERPGLTASLIGLVSAGHGPRVMGLVEKAELVESMEPLWHAVRAEAGEEVEPLPAEIMDAVKDIRREIEERRRTP